MRGVSRRMMLDAALELADYDFKIFPVHTISNGACSCGNQDCRNPGKHPRTQHGAKAATSDQEQIKKWWQQWPNANVAVALLESGLIDVECDSPEAEQEYTHRVLDDPPICPTFGSSRGKHRLFMNPGTLPPTKHLGSIEVRGTSPNMYSVFPPSLHASGAKYQWLVPLDECALPPLPAALLVELLGHEPEAAPSKQPKEHWQRIAQGVVQGERNIDMASYIGRSLRGMISLEDVEGLAHAYVSIEAVNSRFHPPLDNDELQRTFESILKRERERRVSEEINSVIAPGAEPLASGGKTKQPGNWHTVVETGPPHMYRLYADQFQRARGGYLYLNEKQFISGSAIRQESQSQAHFPLPKSFAASWDKRTKGEDGKMRPSLYERLLLSADFEEMPAEMRRKQVVAQAVAEELLRAREEEEPDNELQKPIKLPDGSIVFRFNRLLSDLSWDWNRDKNEQITRQELSRLLRDELQAKPDANIRPQRFRLTPDGWAHLQSLAEGE